MDALPKAKVILRWLAGHVYRIQGVRMCVSFLCQCIMNENAKVQRRKKIKQAPTLLHALHCKWSTLLAPKDLF